jgi:hypothetical protein
MVITAATATPTVQAAAPPPAIDLLGLDCGGKQNNGEDDWSKFEAVGVGGRNQGENSNSTDLAIQIAGSMRADLIRHF